MKDAFRQDDKDFEEMIFKNAAQQDLHGSLGNEGHREVIIDQWGRKEEISYRITTVRTDEHGIPFVYTERGAKQLACGHIAHSLDEVLGKCTCGSTVCIKCSMYICEWCGITVCDRCAIICKGGSILCCGHETKRKFLVVKNFLLGP